MKTRIIHDHLFILWEQPRITLHDDAFYLAILLIWIVGGQIVFLLSKGMEFKPKPALTFICGPGAWLMAIYKKRKMKGVITPPLLPKESWKMPHGRN